MNYGCVASPHLQSAVFPEVGAEIDPFTVNQIYGLEGFLNTWVK